jgi:hypothetical protein
MRLEESYLVLFGLRIVRDAKCAKSLFGPDGGNQRYRCEFLPRLKDIRERDTGVEPVLLPWEGSAQPIGQSRDAEEFYPNTAALGKSLCPFFRLIQGSKTLIRRGFDLRQYRRRLRPLNLTQIGAGKIGAFDDAEHALAVGALDHRQG